MMRTIMGIVLISIQGKFIQHSDLRMAFKYFRCGDANCRLLQAERIILFIRYSTAGTTDHNRMPLVTFTPYSD